MPLINCEINRKPTWSANFVITNSAGAERFADTMFFSCITPTTEYKVKLVKFQGLNAQLPRMNIYKK